MHPGYFYPLTAACFLLSCRCFGAALPRQQDGSELTGFEGMLRWLKVYFLCLSLKQRQRSVEFSLTTKV